MSPSSQNACGAFDLDRPWALAPQVSIRPESFGALAYHFGTRRLSFLKTPQLRDVVTTLVDHPSPRAACRAAGLSDEQLPAYERSLAGLAATSMIVPRSAA
jgi:putative mycofactocin binding protein MftB